MTAFYLPAVLVNPADIDVPELKGCNGPVAGGRFVQSSADWRKLTWVGLTARFRLQPPGRALMWSADGDSSRF